MDYRTIDPRTGELLERFEPADRASIEHALDRAHAAFEDWRRRSFADRAVLLHAAADAFEARATALAELMALEMGKRLEEGEAEAAKCGWACRHYADHAEGYLAPSPRESDAREAFVRHDPLGPVLAIMPWNYPLWQFVRFAAPALMAGNTVLLKHAPNTPRCAIALERLFLEAGLPEGAVQNLFLTNEQAAEVIGDDRVRAVTLTGSTGAGSAVAATAGRHVKPVVLELGGSDPFVVLDDADLERAAATGVDSRCLNSGQSCIAAKRFIVAEAVHDEFRERLVDGMRARTTGDPKRRDTRLGPLAREDLRERLARQVRDAVDAGGRVLVGGEPQDGPGWFFPATVIDGLPTDAPVAREELFGPVAVLARVADDDEAVELANDSPYGLGASVWTADEARARALVPRIEAGAVFVNGLVKSDPRLPFGGVKRSGFGRELSREGILEFVNAKTVWIG